MADAVAFVLSDQTHSMPLLVHLEELRKRIILSTLGVVAGFVGCWSFVSVTHWLLSEAVSAIPLERAFMIS